MNVSRKLTAIFLILICLTLLMCAYSIHSTRTISQAHDETFASLQAASQTTAESKNISQSLSLLREVRGRLATAMGEMHGRMLQNDQAINAMNDTVMSQFFSADQLGNYATILGKDVTWTESIVSDFNQVQTLSTAVDEAWQPSHVGLYQELSELKRTILYWTLKVTNMLFVQSSIDELLYEDIADSPVEQFRQGKTYQRYADGFPALKEAMDKVSASNEELMGKANELDMLIFFSKWDEARKFFRDNFPMAVKGMMVDLDMVIMLEDRLLKAQEQARAELDDELLPKVNQLQAKLQTIEDELTEIKLSSDQAVVTAASQVVSLNEAIQEKITAISRSSLIFAGLIICIGVLACVLGTRMITVPLKKVIHMLQRLEDGDLDYRLELRQKDEFGQLAKTLDAFADTLKNEILNAFNRLAVGDLTVSAEGVIKEPLKATNDALNDVMLRIQGAAEQISGGSRQMSESSASLAAGATEASSSLEQISQLMNLMHSSSADTARNADRTDMLAKEATDAARAGHRQVGDMQNAMQEISRAGESIRKIISVIDEIAFQTNLLALNAAVEAARAGQHGKGFAVVAEEVRNLAARSSKAANETSELIQASLKKVANGSKIAEETSAALEDIVTSNSRVSDLIAEIASASNRQASGVSDVNDRLEEIERVISQSMAISEESASVGQILSSQAHLLQDLLSGFTLIDLQDSPFQQQIPDIEGNDALADYSSGCHLKLVVN